MCVIYVANRRLPDMDELQRGAEGNKDGAGLGWLAPQPGKKGSQDPKDLIVHWKKDFTGAEDLHKYIVDKKIPFPLIIHFRTNSVGPAIPELAHPFPVCEGAPLWTTGTAPEVLFHNGHIGNWEDLVLNVGLKSTDKFPTGEWSDSRALAWLCHLKGHGVLDFVIKSSRVAMLFSDPDTVGTDDYDRELDHITLYGSGWIHKDGFSQSIETSFRNRGGVRIHEPVRGEKKEFGPTKDEGSSCEKSTHVTVGVFPENLWTVSECLAALSDLEKEQRNARVAAGV